MLLRDIAPRVSGGGDMRDSYLLGIAIRLYKTGDPTYARLLDAPMNGANVSERRRYPVRSFDRQPCVRRAANFA